MGGAGAVGSRCAGAAASSAGAGAERGARPRRSHLGPHGGKGHRPYRPSDEEAAEGQRTGAGRRPQGGGGILAPPRRQKGRSEEHTSELQSLMRKSYAVFCLKTKST